MTAAGATTAEDVDAERWRRLLAWAQSEVAGAGEGTRNDTLSRTAYAVGGAARLWCFDAGEALTVLVAAAASTGLSPREAQQTARKALEAGTRRPTLEPTEAHRATRQQRAPGAARRTVASAPVVPLPEVIEDLSRPDATELAALWEACGHCQHDDQVATWLADKRGLSPVRVDQWGLARVLPADGAVPPWARYGSSERAHPWSRTGHRLLLPLYDERGQLVSVKARAVVAHDKKTLNPSGGHSVKRTILACPIARAWLRGGTMTWCGDATAYVAKHGLIVTEGEMDFLTLATLWDASRRDVEAVVGLFQGTDFPETFALRVPVGTSVYLLPHPDPKGQSYMNAVRVALEGRCTIYTAKPLKEWK